MTGDTVDKGGGLEAFRLAKQFYSKLLARLELTPDKLLLVPGNHDIPRRKVINSLLSDVKQEDFDDFKTSEEYWETFGRRFSKYNEFEQDVTNIGLSDDIFGGKIRNINLNDCIVQFIQINSAWSTTGDNDYQNLFIGRWQLEKLKMKKDLLDKPDISIGLIHHPLEWLRRDEKDLLTEFLRDTRNLPIEALLHGHIHSGKIESISNPDGSFISLVSGLGYPDSSTRSSGQSKLSNCRYGIYTFNIDDNLIDIWLRITRSDGIFVADTALYKLGKDDGHFQIPLTERVLPSKNEGTDILYKKQTQDVELDPIPLVADWVGRENEILKLTSPKLKAAAITGVGGQGKTALATEFLRRYAKGESKRFDLGIWVDCREVPDSLHTKIIQLLEKISSGKEKAGLYKEETIEETSKRLLKHLVNTKSLIVFDNIDAYIRTDKEGPTGEFKPIVDAILNNEHNSFVLFTCRPPFNDSRGSFSHIKLSGLSSEEGVDFFKKRGINLEDKSEIKHCKELVDLTMGHPLWLGLITGQILTHKDTIEKIVDKFSKGNVPTTGTLMEEYFEEIWKDTNNQLQDILRYLVEAPRPLTSIEIYQAIITLGPSKIDSKLRRLERLGLLERHEINNNLEVYQVHPLMSEFIHQTFNREQQVPFVQKILAVFLPINLVQDLFKDKLDDDNYLVSVAAKNVIDSIDTCLFSRNENQALALLQKYGSILLENGLTHQFTSLALRTLDSVDWLELGVVNKYRPTVILINMIDNLSLQDDKRFLYYLKKYETLVEPYTLAYLGFLNVSSHLAWQYEKDYKKAISFVDQFDEISSKLKGGKTWDIFDKKMIRALSFRDSGNLTEAKVLFNELIQSDNENAEHKGNMARTLMKLEQFDEAEILLRESLIILKEKIGSSPNIGYAYMWIAELLFKQQKYHESAAFISLAISIWTVYAPLLLREVQNLKTKLDSIFMISVPFEEAQIIEEKFLMHNKSVH
jgi:hypothetical protein